VNPEFQTRPSRGYFQLAARAIVPRLHFRGAQALTEDDKAAKLAGVACAIMGLGLKG